MLKVIHTDMGSCFDPANLPSISDPWKATTVLDEVITLKNLAGANRISNSIMVELAVSGWIVVNGNTAYPVFADQPLTMSLKDITTLKIIGAIGTKYRWISMFY